MADTPTEAIEIEPLTDAEAEAALIALVETFDRLGCCPVAMIDTKEDEGISFSLHFAANRVRKLVASAPQEPDDDAVEKLGSLIFMRCSDQTDHNAFISGFAYGRFSELDSEMALHWFMRGASTPAECGIVSEPRNLLTRLAPETPYCGIVVTPGDEATEWPIAAVFELGAQVKKKGRASWRGTVVGWYRTELTALGLAVESAFEPGSVQIYPQSALEPWNVEQAPETDG